MIKIKFDGTRGKAEIEIKGEYPVVMAELSTIVQVSLERIAKERGAEVHDEVRFFTDLLRKQNNIEDRGDFKC